MGLDGGRGRRGVYRFRYLLGLSSREGEGLWLGRGRIFGMVSLFSLSGRKGERECEGIC